MNIPVIFCVIACVAVIVNALGMRKKMNTLIVQRPDLEKGYKRIFLVWGIVLIIPLIIILTGVVTGLTKDVSDFGDLQNKNPISIALFAYCALVTAVAIRWLYFRNGAKFLIGHPGIFRWRGFSEEITERKLKLFLTYMLLIPLLFIVQLYFMHGSKVGHH